MPECCRIVVLIMITTVNSQCQVEKYCRNMQVCFFELQDEHPSLQLVSSHSKSFSRFQGLSRFTKDIWDKFVGFVFSFSLENVPYIQQSKEPRQKCSQILFFFFVCVFPTKVLETVFHQANNINWPIK